MTKYYIFVFNGLDLLITGPFPNENEAILAERRISLSNTHICMGGERIQGLREFTFWDCWEKEYPEFTFPSRKA